MPLWITVKAFPYVLTLFGIITLVRRRFEIKHLLTNAIITLVVWWIFVFSLIMLIFIGCIPLC